MDKKKQKKIGNKIKAKKIVKKMLEWVKDTRSYSPRKDLDIISLTEALYDYMALVVRANVEWKHDEYTTTENLDKSIIIKDFMMLQHLVMKDWWDISELNLFYPELWEETTPGI